MNGTKSMLRLGMGTFLSLDEIFWTVYETYLWKVTDMQAERLHGAGETSRAMYAEPYCYGDLVGKVHTGSQPETRETTALGSNRLTELARDSFIVAVCLTSARLRVSLYQLLDAAHLRKEGSGSKLDVASSPK
ncbi:hypothetical protein F1559_004913 [Cyanidiococcus yangmingshanensis]|uniref:Uncharacterized protein n=1 Tax=Cyanidiococcus yangmingshanensis TaxID=2690220 RepID=A0A7J7IRN1_9RHOD|nr:hypothetical protein F1559_004913 [Cyanidiococcus yangmingshanensis]